MIQSINKREGGWKLRIYLDWTKCEQGEIHRPLMHVPDPWCWNSILVLTTARRGERDMR